MVTGNTSFKSSSASLYLLRQSICKVWPARGSALPPCPQHFILLFLLTVLLLHRVVWWIYICAWDQNRERTISRGNVLMWMCVYMHVCGPFQSLSLWYWKWQWWMLMVNFAAFLQRANTTLFFIDTEGNHQQKVNHDRRLNPSELLPERIQKDERKTNKRRWGLRIVGGRKWCNSWPSELVGGSALRNAKGGEILVHRRNY